MVSQNAEIISPIAVDAVLTIIDPKTAINVDLNDIKIVKQAGQPLQGGILLFLTI